MAKESCVEFFNRPTLKVTMAANANYSYLNDDKKNEFVHTYSNGRIIKLPYSNFIKIILRCLE